MTLFEQCWMVLKKGIWSDEERDAFLTKKLEED